jgi:myo-inositol-1(or 4)-monophosphatase
MTEMSVQLEQIAVRAARGVGDALRAAYAQAQQPSYKRDHHDLVTEHDQRTERVLRAELLGAWPDSAVLGEEGGASGDGAVRWLVDPIDGTANFALGLPFFAVSIGAVANDQLVAGVVYDVMRDTAFSANLHGAYADGEPLRSTGPASDAQNMLITSYPGPGTLAAGRGVEEYTTLLREFGAVRRMGSTALALAYVAAGAGCAYAYGIHPWDVAAGALIVRQAGGRYLPLPDTDRPWEAPGYLAVNGDFDLPGSCLTDLLPRMLPRTATGTPLPGGDD